MTTKFAFIPLYCHSNSVSFADATIGHVRARRSSVRTCSCHRELRDDPHPLSHSYDQKAGFRVGLHAYWQHPLVPYDILRCTLGPCGQAWLPSKVNPLSTTLTPLAGSLPSALVLLFWSVLAAAYHRTNGFFPPNLPAGRYLRVIKLRLQCPRPRENT